MPRNHGKSARAPSLDDYLETIDRIYDAAYDLDRWPKAMAGIAGVLNGHRAQMFAPGVRKQGLWVSHEVSPEMMRGYGEYYHQTDVWSQRSYRILTHPGATIQNDMAVSEEEYARSEFWTDFARHADIFRNACVAIDVPENLPAMRMHLAVYRPRAAEQFRPADRAFLQRIQPHILRSLKLGRLLAAHEAERSHLRAMLDATAKPVLAVSAGARVVYANAPAEDLLRQRNGLATRAARLVGATEEQTSAIAHAVGIATGSVGHTKVGCRLCLPRPLTGDELRIEVLPLPESDRIAPSTAALALVIVDAPKPRERESIARFGAAYSLTAAEVKLVHALLDAGSLLEAAAMLGVRHSTARSQLKSVFQKTGARRQAQLVGLVLGFVR